MMKKSAKKKQKLSAKQQKIIWGVGIAVVALISVFLAIKAVETSEEIVQFFNSNDEIIAITIQGDEGFKIEKDQDQWTVLDRLEETDQEAVLQALAVLNQMGGEKVEAKRQSVGLDFPRLAIRVDYDDDSTKRVSLGHPDPTGGGYYVEVQGDDLSGVYFVENILIDYLPLKVNNYLVTALLPWTPDQVESIKINREQELVQLTKSSPYPAEETRTNVGGWFVAEPYTHYYGTSYTEMQELNQALQTLQMNEIVEKDVADWSQYGLNSSDFSIEFSTADDQRTLLIGAAETESTTFARFADTNDVFSIANELLTPFEQPASDYHDGYIKIIALDNLNQLSIESERLTVDVNVEKDGDDVHFKVNDQFLFEKGFREAYTAIAGLPVAGLSEGAVYQEAEITITSTIALEDGEKVVILELVDYDEEHYAAFVNQESDFLVKKAHVDETLTVIEQVLEY